MRSLLTLILLLFLPGISEAANTFTVTVAAGSEVTMQDPNATLPFTVTNESASKDIRQITFEIGAAYTFGAATVPPAGWCIDDLQTNAITFALRQGGGACSNGSTGNQIAPGSSLTFNVNVLPAAASQDVSADTLTDVTVSSQGGFSLSGGLPVWTRRSLVLSMTAVPASIGIGGEIALTMEVTNQSTSTLSNVIAAVVPVPSAAIVTNTRGPYYGSTLLNGDHLDTITTITVDTTDEFASSGVVRMDDEEIYYAAKTATELSGAVRGYNATIAAPHVDDSRVWNLEPRTLLPGESARISYIFRADFNGTVFFTANATDVSGVATSKSVDSNTVAIGDFTASLGVAPTLVIDGQTVNVIMTVTNNGPSALINVAPSVLAGCAGGAIESAITGPAPGLISSLAGSNSGTFQWTSTINGTTGQTYCFTGSATANGPVATNGATSNSGTVSEYSLTVTPSTVPSGSVNRTVTWNVYNGGGCQVKEVSIDLPTIGSDWQCGSVTPPSGWAASCADPVPFTTNSDYIDPGATGSFSITFSTTETVTADKVVSFPVSIIAKGCGSATTTVDGAITVTLHTMTLSHAPAGPIEANGTSRYTMTATLASGGVPLSGKTVIFTTTNGALDSATAVTDSNGRASVDLIAPNSTTDTSATVTATYLDAESTDTVSFIGYTGPNLQYWGGLVPTSVECGTAYSFTMNVRNISTTASMTLDPGTYFAFNDPLAGGTAVFIAYLDSAPVSIPASTTGFLTFGSPTAGSGGGGVTVPAGFLAGTYLPTATPSPLPASGLFFTDNGTNDQYRDVTDTVTVGGTCGTGADIITIDWHEMY